MAIDLQLATFDDLPELCTLLTALFEQECEFTPDMAAQNRGLASIIGNPRTGLILVARARDPQPGGLLGMVNLLFTISTAHGARVAILEDMVVAPGARKNGVGARLLAYAIEQARAAGCRRITLLTDDANTGGHRFYQRSGFQRSTMVPFRLVLPD
jgi:GNAT superfamily N-acetyltransferase